MPYIPQAKKTCGFYGIYIKKSLIFDGPGMVRGDSQKFRESDHFASGLF
jgi:hypothetical protein